jgi:hypothetical protein
VSFASQEAFFDTSEYAQATIYLRNARPEKVNPIIWVDVIGASVQEASSSALPQSALNRSSQ